MCDSSSLLKTGNEDLDLEIESLFAIYGDDDLKIERSGSIISISLCVSSNYGDQSSVAGGAIILSMLINAEIVENYPSDSPIVRLSRVRGLTDENVAHLHAEIRSHLRKNQSCPVLFDIFELCKSYLNDHESLKLTCAICLSRLRVTDLLCGTECAHFFHCDCLMQHFSHQTSQFEHDYAGRPPPEQAAFDWTNTCPVCRTRLVNFDRQSMQSAMNNEPHVVAASRRTRTISSTDDSDFDLSFWRDQQQQLCQIFERQRLQGGIINVEEQKHKWRIDEQTHIERPTSAINQELHTEAPVQSATSQSDNKLPEASSSDPDQTRSSTSNHHHNHGGLRGRGGYSRGRGYFHPHYRNYHHKKQSHDKEPMPTTSNTASLPNYTNNRVYSHGNKPHRGGGYPKRRNHYNRGRGQPRTHTAPHAQCSNSDEAFS